MATFDLVAQPWIPCLMADGRSRELGLLDTLVRAHEIRECLDGSPLVTVGLHRLMLAVLHRVFGPPDLPAWQELWQAGRWRAADLAAYFARLRGRFDLFHAERPFYQVPSMQEAKTHPVQALALEAAAGNNPTLFDHNYGDNPQPVSAGQAARWLVAGQAYSIGFGKSHPFYFRDAPLVRGYTVLAQGETLFETLVLNLMPYNEYAPIPRLDQDLPAWEQDVPATPDEGGTPFNGYLDYLTWQSRRFHLFPEGDPPVVRFCQVQQNLRLMPEPEDPFKCYLRDKKRGLVPLGMSRNRALWRDAHTLLEFRDTPSRLPGEALSKRPEIFNWLARIERARLVGTLHTRPRYSFAVAGFGTEIGKAASVVLWRYERLPLPMAYLNQDNVWLLDLLRSALDKADEVGNALRQATWHLARLLVAPDSVEPQGRQPAAQDVGAVTTHLDAERLYWPHLEAPFRGLLLELPERGATAVGRWREVLYRTARDAFETMLAGLDQSAETLKASALSEQRFGWLLNKALPKDEEANLSAATQRE